MKVAISQAPVRWIVQWTQWALLAAGVSMLGYCGFVAMDAWTFQQAESRALEQATPLHSPAKTERTVAAGGSMGRLEVPRLGVSTMVIEGTSARTLRRGAGHISGTALPGRPGNVGISGHRDTVFRPLRNIRQNDVIMLTTAVGEYRYRVVSARVVSPDDVAVLKANGSEVLTLVTCYTFYFVGPAPNRFIIRAERII